MIEHSAQSETMLEVIAPDKSRQTVAVTQSPFFMGRGGETDNHLELSDGRISRRSGSIVIYHSGFHLEDRGNRYGLFVNGIKVQQQPLHDGDIITFGVEDSYQIIVRAPAFPVVAPQAEVQNLLTRIGTLSDLTGSSIPGGLSKLNLLLEATSLLHSQLPLDSVLGTMLDHAISITHADRGLLMEPDASGSLRVHLARGNKADSLPPETLNPSQTAVNQAINRRSAVITEDLNLAGLDLKAAESVVIQGLRAVDAIPL